MTDLQRCRQAATDPACLEKSAVLQLPEHYLELIHEAAQAYHRVLNARVIYPESAPARRARLDAAVSMTVSIIKQVEREARHV